VTLDLAVLALLALSALLGAAGGALRQLVQLGAAVLGWLAARHLGAAVAAGLGRTLPALLARAVAPSLLFLGTFALASLVGGAVLRSSGLASVVRGPVDRAGGALLGGAKGALVAWVLLSALALAGGAIPGADALDLRGSDFAAVARANNLLLRLDPGAARGLERALRATREAERAGRRDADPEGKALLDDPRIRALVEGEGELDTAEAARLLEDPAVRALVERMEKAERRRMDGAEAR
jgi:membrane protein required for colicin V production